MKKAELASTCVGDSQRPLHFELIIVNFELPPPRRRRSVAIHPTMLRAEALELIRFEMGGELCHERIE